MLQLKQYEKEEIDNVVSIGVIMFGLLGDVLLRTPVIDALKKIYPDATITVLVDNIGFEVFKNNPKVDTIIKVSRSRKPRYKYLLNKITTIYKVRKKKFSLLIDLYNNDSTKLVTKLSSAKYKLGFSSEKGQYCYNIMSDVNVIESENNSMTMGYLKILYPLMPTLDYSIQPTLVVRDETLKTIQLYLDDFNVSLDNLYMLNLGSRDMEKTFKSSNYLKIVKYMYKRYSFVPLVVQNPSQEYLQENFIKDYLVPNSCEYCKLKSLSIEEIGAMMKIAKFIITPDTGLLHIASAVKLPTIGLFTYTPVDEVIPEDNIFESLNEAWFDSSDSFNLKANKSMESFVAKI